MDINLTNLLIVLIALLHVAFMLLEMFFWTRPAGRKIFHLKHDFAQQSAALAANQGLYNGFLAAGLVFGLLSAPDNQNILVFVLSCIVIAGVFGALTASRLILFVQALPAALALLLLFLS